MTSDRRRPLTFHLILHTHWDREWYLPRAGFLPRLVSAGRDLLALLEGQPDARFVLDGQTILVEDLLGVEPAWRDRIHKQVTQDRLEVGPWYILADELIPSGESLLRNLLLGARDASALGSRMNVLYSPDAFGHPAALPTLAREFGIDAAVVWRGLGGSGTDRDLYHWRGPDGSKVLLYHLPPSGYEIGAELATAPDTMTRYWRAIRDGLVARAATSHVAVFVGADHHAPPCDAVAIRNALQEIESGNMVRLSTLGEYFAAVATDPVAPDRTKLLQGELRWSYGHTWTLQGTHATRSRLKRRHAAVELSLHRKAEALAALAEWHRALDQRAILRATWRTLLRCQFHDTLCGCCSDAVADEQATRLTSAQAMSEELIRASINALTHHDPDAARDTPHRGVPTLLLWNPAARTRSGVVIAEVTRFRRDVLVGPPSQRTARSGAGAESFVLLTDDDVAIPVQVLSVRREDERIDAARHYPDQDEVDRVLVAFDAPPSWGLGVTAFSPRPGTASPPATSLHVRDGYLGNRYIEVHIEPEGRVNLVDRRSGERYPDLLQVISEPDLGDTYTPSIVTGVTNALCAGPIATLATGQLIGAIEIPFRVAIEVGGAVRGRIVCVVFADSPALRVRVELENQAINHRVRIRLPVGTGSEATAGAAFGFERRAPLDVVDDYPAETPVPTAPAHRYVAAGQGARGIALCSPGSFEYEWTTQHELVLTALRSTGELSRDTLPERPGHAGWPTPTPGAQEPGMHVVEFAVTPIGDPELLGVAGLEQLWEDIFLPPQPRFIRDFVGVPAAHHQAGVSLEGSGLIFSALKLAEDGPGIVFRCYNSTAAAVSGRIVSRSPVAGAVLLRADESPIEELTVDDGAAVRFTAPPRAIVTVLLVPA